MRLGQFRPISPFPFPFHFSPFIFSIVSAIHDRFFPLPFSFALRSHPERHRTITV